MKPIFDILTEIANRHLNIPTLKERRSDSLDFHEVSVWGMKDALWYAYQAGVSATAGSTGAAPEMLEAPRRAEFLTRRVSDGDHRALENLLSAADQARAAIAEATDALWLTGSQIEITEDEFDSRFPVVTNHLNPNASWCLEKEGGCLFETYGEELEFVRQQDPSTVWTLLDGDDSDQYLVSGFHFVNRIGYLISTVPVPEGADIQVHIPMENPDDAETNHAEEE